MWLVKKTDIPTIFLTIAMDTLVYKIDRMWFSIFIKTDFDISTDFEVEDTFARFLLFRCADSSITKSQIPTFLSNYSIL